MCITTKYSSNNTANITDDIRSNYTYVEDPPWRNKTNKLKKIEKYNSKYFDLVGEYTYDPDGNFTSLTRSYNSDNFSYDYYSGTNRLKKVTGSTDQFTYDYNGNQTNDYFAGNTGISYDHRNLITEITRSDNTTDPPTTIKIRYKYDEAGNRIRKTIYQTQDENPSPITNGDNPTGWTITKDEYYSRDASGKEIAVYQGYTLDYWNVWGTGNEGRIKSTGMKYFYLKDHLGSIRAVINQNNVLVEAQDYDPWGHIARTWDSTSADYKFTGKEHDKESTYDYFGARYYDSRVANWGSIDPLFEKHIQWTPYNYVLRNPMMLIDPDGRQLKFSNINNIQDAALSLNNLKHGFGQQYAKYFRIKFSADGSIILDSDILKKAGIKNNKYYDAILRIALGNVPVNYRNLVGNEHFYALDNDDKKTKRRYTFSNELKNAYGFTLTSGKDNFSGDQKPTAISPKGECEVLINKYYNQLDQVQTTGHETGHADNYLSGEIWALEKRHPELNDLVTQNETTSESGFKTWAKKAE